MKHQNLFLKSITCISFLLSLGFGHVFAAQWGYEGQSGPDNWGKLSPDYATCAIGRNQSPINIQGALTAPLTPLKTNYRSAAKDIVNNGHTIQIGFSAGNTLTLDDTQYELKQVHFHAPSENQIENISYPLEAHLVHADANGNLAVVAVMYREGNSNKALAKLWSEMPTTKNETTLLKTDVIPSDLLPESLAYYRFNGSLTTPPCSEGVRWIVLKQSLTASKKQIALFEQLMQQHTNRPTQPINARIIVN